MGAPHLDPIWILATTSVALLVFVALNFVVARAHKKKPAEKPADYTVDAQTLIHDLTRHGSAVVRIEVVNLSDVLLRSPRTTR